MTTKILTGVYGATYNLASPVTTLSIASTGYLAGGVASSGFDTYSPEAKATSPGSISPSPLPEPGW